ncbi:MAG: Rv2578c family radical SAM protein [Jiangellaceae bacterium]
MVRWDGQQVGAEDGAALPGMGRIPGLVRSVTTPEFAGVTFHEVRARSVLNEVPGQSMVPFRWTVNPYRGCTHACTYCLSGDTLVMLASGRVRRLADVRVGDSVYGTELRAGVRRYVATEVRAHWQTAKPGIAVELDDGAVVVASGDHRFLTPTGWKHVAPGACADAAARPYLTTGDDLVGLGRDQVGRAVGRGGLPIAADAQRRVVRVEPVGGEVPMYDLTTGTGDFVANGVVSHNCFARGSHSWLELDPGRGFDTEIVVKVNAAEVLGREVGRRSWTREHVALGTNTDPYQRAEGRYRLMPGIIRALARSRTPFSVLTKGTLLRRDLPLLAEASRSVPVGLGVSIAIYEPALHASLEPGTPSPRARLDLVRAIRTAGFDCAVLLAPVLPRLTDSAGQLESAVAQLADAGATGVTEIPLHLRPGAREWFMAWLERERPELVPVYLRLYARGSYVSRDYREWLSRQVQPLLSSHGLDGPASVRDGAADPAPPVAGAASPRQLSLL